MKPTVFDGIRTNWKNGKFICIGLDPVFEHIPQSVKNRFKKITGNAEIGAYLSYMESVVEATHDLVCAYKINPAFWESAGPEGVDAICTIIKHIDAYDSDVSVILDAKRADCSHTMERYKVYDFVYREADAVTVNPYLGKEAVQPYLDEEDKGIFVLCHTSNDGAREFQHLRVKSDGALYCQVAQHVSVDWNINGNCGLVVGATNPTVLQNVRSIDSDIPILVPSIGAQGGDITTVVRSGKGSNDFGLIPTASRSIIYTPDPRKEVEDLTKKVERALKPRKPRKKSKRKYKKAK